MPEFLLCSWRERVMWGSYEYRIDAPTLEDAVELLRELQREADDGEEGVAHERVRALSGGDDVVMPLDDLDECVETVTGIMLIEESGERIRNLVEEPIVERLYRSQKDD